MPNPTDRHATRTIVDESGRPWLVREVDTRLTPGARRPRCLLCEGEGVVRRVWAYPVDWRHCPDAELAAACGLVRPRVPAT